MSVLNSQWKNIHMYVWVVIKTFLWSSDNYFWGSHEGYQYFSCAFLSLLVYIQIYNKCRIRCLVIVLRWNWSGSRSRSQLAIWRPLLQTEKLFGIADIFCKLRIIYPFLSQIVLILKFCMYMQFITFISCTVRGYVVVGRFQIKITFERIKSEDLKLDALEGDLRLTESKMKRVFFFVSYACALCLQIWY